MSNSSAMCRREAAHHRQVATASPLDKVRQRALKAANAWEAEAAEAEAREAGTPGTLSPEDAAIALEFRLEEEEEARSLARDEGDSLPTPAVARTVF
ncbi:MAG TPA: hypothetical protein VJM81_08825 [Rhizorhapis sp.]|nr:hypothetical protein [Rhizorhapis sp.]